MAQQVKKCFSTEFIDANGKFNTNGVAKFEKDVKLAERGRSYGVVSIMGPQSSGKSTLLNHLFGSEFKEMDAQLGWHENMNFFFMSYFYFLHDFILSIPRIFLSFFFFLSIRFQTTKGICLAQSPSTESCILVLDTEGSDGAERRDNTSFERQTALFAIAISDIVMINLWQRDIGRRNAASWPLLSVVFEVMLRVLTPRKVHLMFVLRDSLETPLEMLQMQLMQQLEEIWNEIPKPPAQVNTALNDRFKIEVVALASYKHQTEQFKEEVATLRERVVCSIASSELATNRTNASAFALNAKMMWDQIKENKDLDLPRQTVMVAEVRCDQIFQEKYQNFCDNTTWIKIKDHEDSGAVIKNFGRIVSSLVDSYLFKYDNETLYFDEAVRVAKRKQLKEKLLQDIEPTYRSLLERIRNTTMEDFKEAIRDGIHQRSQRRKRLEEVAQYQTRHLLNEIDNQFKDAAVKQANWNHATRQRETLLQDMRTYVDRVREALANDHNTNVATGLRVGWTVCTTVLSIGLAILGIQTN